MRPSRLLRARRLACLLATGALLVACADDRPAEPAEGLSAVAVYGRHAAVRGKVDLRLVNAGEAAVEVERLRLRHPLFEDVPPTSRHSVLDADGEVRVVPLAFGAPRCDVTDAAGAVVVLGVRTPRGVQDIEVPLADGEPGLVRAHTLACAAAAVADAAALELGPAWTREDGPDGPRLRTTLRATRRGAGAVEVTEVGRSILYGADAPSLVLATDQGSAEVPVLLAATRCDPHALTESKTSFTFPLRVRLDGGEEVATSVTAPEPGRVALEALLEETCGAP